MSKKSFVFIASILFIVSGFILNSFLIQSSNLYKIAKEELADALSYKNRFLDVEEWVPLEGAENAKGFNYKNQKIKVNLFFESSSVQKER